MNCRYLVPLLAVMLLVAGCTKSKPDCQGTAQVCSGSCVELKSDNLNCGACGNTCSAGQVCSNGACSVTCVAGLVNCGGTCVDPLTSTSHCGASGTCSSGAAGQACPSGQQCSGGTCSCPTSKPDACGTGATAFCTSKQNDPQNCGTCSTVCAAGQVCSVGNCVQTCSASEAAACPAVNPTYCANTGIDANNCGSCGTVCDAGQQCSGGICSCPAATPDACSTLAGARFCTNNQADPLNCGACGSVCAAGTACSAGSCVTSCPAGEYACSGKCIDPRTDVSYCGAMADCTGGVVCGVNGACRAGVCDPFQSCKAVLDAGASKGDGIYVVDPDGTGSAPSISVYCDMTTSGGGWTLALAYEHPSGGTNALVSGVVPIDPLHGYSHLSGAQLAQLPFGTMRFFCQTSNHTRKIHVIFAGAGAVAYVKSSGSNAVANWTTFTPMSDHTAFLPAAATDAAQATPDALLTNHTFFKASTYHWLLSPNTGDLSQNRFECDDYTFPSPASTTLHQVWVR